MFAEFQICAVIPLRWCVTTPVQLEKCTQLAMAAETERLQPQITCEMARSYAECKSRLVHDWADMTSLLAEELYDSITDFGFAPVAAEKYDNGATDSYLVAVVRKGSNVSFSELKTSRSCHAGAFNTLSWNAPLVLLKEKNMLHLEHCEFAAAAQRFFWESCVPEIKDNLHEGLVNIGPLCAACGGLDKCGRESRFHGEDGALECLSHKYGDIAFVTNRTLLSPQNFASAQDFELLCLDGSKAPVTEYDTCHWLRVPGKYLVVAGKRFTAEDRLKVTQMLMDVQKSYGLTVEPGKFSIFPTVEDPDTIFSPQTRELLPVVPKQTIEETLGRDYATVYRYMHYCKNSSPGTTPNSITTFSILFMFLLLFIRR